MEGFDEELLKSCKFANMLRVEQFKLLRDFEQIGEEFDAERIVISLKR